MYPVEHYNSRMVEVQGRMFAVGGYSKAGLVKRVYEWNKEDFSWTLFKNISAAINTQSLTLIPYNLG